MGLDFESAVGYLQARGVADPSLARQMATQFGGSPLSLKLAVELAAREGTGQGGTLDVSTHQFLFVRLDEAVVQRQLYKRILDHVHDENVRKLAHPGLILRRLTPTLIWRVLAEPCGLKISSLPEAEKLFSDLMREVSLVTVASDKSLVHRQDLRRLMLKLLQSDEPEKAQAIHEAAVRYYENQTPTPSERAEEIYHRLWLGDERSIIDERWITGVEPHLASALTEFSGARRAYLASRLNYEVDEETRQLADTEDWESIVERKALDLLAHEQRQQALDLLASRTDRTNKSPLFAIEAKALASLNRWSESLAKLNEGIDRALSAGERQQATTLALQAAEVVLTFKVNEEAQGVLSRLEGLAEATIDPTHRLDVTARCLMLSRIAPSLRTQTAAPLERQLREEFDALPDDALTGRSILAYWVAAAFGHEDVSRLSRVLRLNGLPRVNGSSLRHLADELTSLDAAFANDLGEPPGSLARRLAIPILGTIADAWTDFVLAAPDRAVRLALCRLIDEYSDFIQPRLIEAFARVMQAAVGIDQNARTELTEPVLSKLGRALLRAFGSLTNLREFMLLRLDRSLDAIVPAAANQSLVVSIEYLINAASSQGWIVDLVARAQEAHPGDALLAEIAEELGISTLAPSQKSSIRPSQLEILRRRVMEYWVDGVLQHSLYNEVLISIGKRRVEEFVDVPFDYSVEVSDVTSSRPLEDRDVSAVYDARGLLLILGEAGSGKTTILLGLTRTLLERARDDIKERVPIVLNLSSWKNKQPLADWILHELRVKYLVPKEIAGPWLRNDYLVPLLDGLDEVETSMQADCVTAINAFIEESNASKLVVCCRLNDYRRLPRRLKLNGAICLEPPSTEEVDEYLERGGSSLAALRGAVKSDAVLRELVRTPLMLNIMSLAFQGASDDELARQKRDSPEERRKQLFSLYAERMFQRKERLLFHSRSRKSSVGSRGSRGRCGNIRSRYFSWRDSNQAG
jgi:hypothetical protein